MGEGFSGYLVLQQLQGLAMACCSQGIGPQPDMWRVSNGSGRIRAAGLGRDELRTSTRWREKRAGNSCFKDDRKPGNVEGLLGGDTEKTRVSRSWQEAALS